MLKRFLGFTSLLICFALLTPQYSLVNLSSSFPKAEFSFYTTSKISEVANANVVKNGNGYIVSCSAMHAKEVFSSLPETQGQSFCVDGTAETLEKVIRLLNATIIKAEQVNEGIYSCYAYTSKLSKFIALEGERVNVHIVLRDGKLTVGMPIILGSF